MLYPQPLARNARALPVFGLGLGLASRGGVGEGGSGASSLLTDLVAYYKLNEATGSTRNDSTANAFNLADNNAVGSADGKIGNAALFVGSSSQFLSVSTDAGLQVFLTKFSISAWINLIAISQNGGIVGNLNGHSTDFILQAHYVDSFHAPYFAALFSNAAAEVDYYPVSVLSWTHIVATYNAGTFLFYINGVLTAPIFSSGSIPSSLSTGNSDTWLGRTPNGYLTGMLDEVGLWNVDLTQKQVTDLFNGGSGVTYPFVNVP